MISTQVISAVPGMVTSSAAGPRRRATPLPDRWRA